MQQLIAIHSDCYRRQGYASPQDTINFDTRESPWVQDTGLSIPQEPADNGSCRIWLRDPTMILCKTCEFKCTACALEHEQYMSRKKMSIAMTCETCRAFCKGADASITLILAYLHPPARASGGGGVRGVVGYQEQYPIQDDTACTNLGNLQTASPTPACIYMDNGANRGMKLHSAC